MRQKLLTFLMSTLLLFGVVNLGNAYDRVVLVEDFTNWGCVPCAIPNTYLHNVMVAMGEDQVFDIAYHMSWPSGNDPFYLANPSENNTRRYYYGVNAVPHMRCDGLSQMSTSSQAAMTAAINARLAVSSHIWMDIEAALNGSNIELTCKTYADQAISGSKMLHMLILDRYTYLPATPNGNPHHYHSMMDMAPSGNGQIFNVSAFDTTTFTEIIPLNPTWELENIDIAAFVQDNANREVLQACVAQFPLDFPGLQYVDYTLEDNGNNDGRAEPGEEAYLYVTLENGEHFQTAVNVVATLSTTDPDLTVTTPTVNFPDIPNGGTGTNTVPMAFEVSLTAQPHMSSVHVEVVSDPLQTMYEFDIDLFIGWPEVLLVDDDGTSIMEDYYMSALDNIGKSYEYWDINTMGVPDPSAVAGYPIMIWFTGWSSVDVLTLEERTLIEDYVDDGGYLFMSGQNIAQGLDASAPTFLTDMLHVTFGTANTMNKELNGTGPDPVWNTLSVDCNSGGAGSGTCTNPDGVTATVPGEEVFVYSTAAYDGGIAYEETDAGKVVFFSFPFEAINGLNSTNTREEVMQAVLDYFGPINSVEPQQNVPVSHELFRVYPNPFNPSTAINYQLSAFSYVTLTVYDLQGREVAELVNDWRDAGYHEVTFDASDLSSGVYFYRMTTGSFEASRKMVLVK